MAPDEHRPNAHVVLVGMSADEMAGRAELLARAAGEGATVAFLQLGDPGVTAELTRLADAGTQSVTLVAVGTGPLVPAVTWLRRVAAHWWRERAEPRPDVLVGTTAEDARRVTGDEPGLESAAFEDFPDPRHQVLVCRGPRCTARGAAESHVALLLATIEHGLGADDVLVTTTGCLEPCNRGPVARVLPAGTWHADVDAAAARRLVDGLGGRGAPTGR